MYVKHRKLILLSVVCVVCTLVQHPVFAYTSTLNPQAPATAPDSYVINIPDANLKAALNQIIANVSPVSTRTPDQSITVKDAKRVSLMY
ncbi:MAG: hypothetical protein Q4B28_08275 [bacterium]|nr:hypothetical protein [bacterium]